MCIFLLGWIGIETDKLGCFADVKIKELIDEPGQVNRPVENEKGEAEGKRFKVEIYFILLFLLIVPHGTLEAIVGYGTYSALRDPNDISCAKYWGNHFEVNILDRVEGGKRCIIQCSSQGLCEWLWFRWGRNVKKLNCSFWIFCHLRLSLIWRLLKPFTGSRELFLNILELWFLGYKMRWFISPFSFFPIFRL